MILQANRVTTGDVLEVGELQLEVIGLTQGTEGITFDIVELVGGGRKRCSDGTLLVGTYTCVLDEKLEVVRIEQPRHWGPVPVGGTFIDRPFILG